MSRLLCCSALEAFAAVALLLSITYVNQIISWRGNSADFVFSKINGHRFCPASDLQQLGMGAQDIRGTLNSPTRKLS